MERRDLDYLKARTDEELLKIGNLRSQKLALKTLIESIDEQIITHHETLRKLTDELESRENNGAQ